MTKPALAVVEPAKPAPDPLVGLIAERNALEAEVSRMNAIRARLAAFTDEETAIIAEIGAIGERELNAVRAWSASNCEGNPPAPDFAAREDAAKRLRLAQAKSGAGDRALAEVDRSIFEAHQKALPLAAKIDVLIADRIEAEHRDKISAITEALAKARMLAADAEGARRAMLSMARDLQGSRREEEARQIFGRVERLTAFNLLDVGPTEREIGAVAFDWAARVGALRNGGHQ